LARHHLRASPPRSAPTSRDIQIPCHLPCTWAPMPALRPTRHPPTGFRIVTNPWGPPLPCKVRSLTPCPSKAQWPKLTSCRGKVKLRARQYMAKSCRRLPLLRGPTPRSLTSLPQVLTPPTSPAHAPMATPQLTGRKPEAHQPPTGPRANAAVQAATHPHGPPPAEQGLLPDRQCCRSPCSEDQDRNRQLPSSKFPGRWENSSQPR
jgi:hypothetical protein